MWGSETPPVADMCSWKTAGYRRANSMWRVGKVGREDLMMDRGRELDGDDDLRRCLRERSGMRLCSFSTAWSRPRSRTGLMVDTSTRVLTWRRRRRRWRRRGRRRVSIMGEKRECARAYR